MSTYSEQGMKAKAAKLGIVEQRPVGSKNQRQRPYVLEQRSKPNGSSSFRPHEKWRKWHSYRTPEEANRAMEQLARKYHFYEYRVRNAGVAEIQ